MIYDIEYKLNVPGKNVIKEKEDYNKNKLIIIFFSIIALLFFAIIWLILFFILSWKEEKNKEDV